MSNLFRKIERNKLKNDLKTNKINESYHEQYDTLEQKMQKIKKEMKGNKKNGRA